MAASRSNWFEKETKTRCCNSHFPRPWCRICHFSIISIECPLFWVRARQSFADKPQLHSKVSACWGSCIFALPRWAAALLSSHHCRCRHGIHRDAYLGASSPVAPRFHVICCNSADQLKRLKHFGTLQCQSGAVRPPALQPPLPSVYLGLPAELNSFLSPPDRVFFELQNWHMVPFCTPLEDTR